MSRKKLIILTSKNYNCQNSLELFFLLFTFDINEQNLNFQYTEEKKLNYSTFYEFYKISTNVMMQ
jgi:hypothetical protein